jgi:hypothetical protein
MYCCAKFSVDDAWYRGRILECVHEKETLTVEVFYVDFGNSEFLPHSRLRHLKKEHAELPQMAVQCSLDGLEDANPSLTKSLKSLIDREFKMTLVKRKGDVLCVRLTDEEGADIAAKFTKEKLHVQKPVKVEEKPAVSEVNVPVTENIIRYLKVCYRI